MSIFSLPLMDVAARDSVIVRAVYLPYISTRFVQDHSRDTASPRSSPHYEILTIRGQNFTAEHDAR